MPHPSPPSARYWELAIPSSSETSEGLTNFLWELGALGVVEEEIGGGPPRLRAFFPDVAAPSSLVARLATYVEGLEALGLGPRAEPELTPLQDAGWADAWRDHFTPIAIGRRLLVTAPWHRAETNGRVVITIEPGRAFGTGHHGSTAGCLAAIETLLESGAPASALDLGTGSGILAIAAARLGAPRVVAVDEDPDAVAGAIANIARNGVADRVRCALAEASTLSTPPASLVIANLLAPAHVRLAPRYRDLVAAHGTLVLGGILDAEADAVRDAIERVRFAAREPVSVQGWTTLVLARDGDRNPRGDGHPRGGGDRAALHDRP